MTLCCYGPLTGETLRGTNQEKKNRKEKKTKPNKNQINKME
jgi:hypothetical protein